ncbi:MAG TPA: hypothetical protein VIF40_08865 [Methylosinus sp.]|uniref:hypothetical protein n=1 Tax=Methylosinus sp. TaxID=427 RepID=UPI002F94D368
MTSTVVLMPRTFKCRASSRTVSRTDAKQKRTANKIKSVAKRRSKPAAGGGAQDKGAGQGIAALRRRRGAASR